MTTLIIKKNLLLILIGMIFITTTTMAQTGPRGDRPSGPPEPPSQEQIQKMVGHLAVDIEMSTQQQKALLEILTNHFDAVKAQRKTDRREMETLKKDLKTQAGEVLDENQLEDFLRLMEKQGPGKKGFPPRSRN